MSNAVERALVAGEWDTATELLDRAQNDFGESAWLVGTSVYLKQNAEGLEAQKRYAAQIRSAARTGGVHAYLTYWMSVSNEPSVGAPQFRDRFLRHASQLRLTPTLDAFVKYRIVGFLRQGPTELAAVLSEECTRNAIDLYEAVIFALRCALASKYDLGSVLSTLAGFVEKVPDQRLTRILIEAGVSLVDNWPVAARDILRAYYRDDEPLAMQLCVKRLRDVPNDSAVLDIATRCGANADLRLNDVSVQLTAIHEKLATVIRRRDGAAEAAGDMTKLARNLPWSTWAAGTAAVARAHSIDLSLLSDDPEVRFLGATCAPYSPLWYEVSRRAFAAERLVAVDDIDIEAIPVALRQQLFARTIRAFRARAYDEAEEAARELLSLGAPAWRTFAARSLANAFVEQGTVLRALELIVDLVLEADTLAAVLPLPRVLSDASSSSSCAQSITWPVGVEMCERHRGNVGHLSVHDAYDDYMSASGVERPSQLPIPAGAQDRQRMVYFLWNVCVESVMDLAVGVFTSSADVADERRKLCDTLVRLDPLNAERYEEHGRAITRRLTIQKRIRQIEQSKIYVDASSLKRTAAKVLREPFDRYTAFIRGGVEAPTDDALSSTMAAAAVTTPGLTVPVSEIADLFLSMLLTLRTEFLWGIGHGLDGYLSVRVRHGTFAGQMRRPVETARIVTPKDALTGEYRRNDYWIGRLKVDSDRLAGDLDGALAAFSRTFDSLITEVQNEWIQIKRAPDDKGAIHLWLTITDVAAVIAQVPVDTTLEQFVDIVLELYRARLEECLEEVRARFKTEVKQRIRDMVSVLEARLERLSRDIDCGQLWAALRQAHTELQVTVDRVTEWFHMAQDLDYEPFSIQEAIDTAASSVRGVRPDFDVTTIVEDARGVKHSGRQFARFADIFFTLFENVVRHSTADDTAPHATATITYHERYVDVVVVNAARRTTDADDRLRAIRAAIGQPQQMQAVAREGGTGLLKIVKILTHDFGMTDAAIQFGFSGEDKFEVRLALHLVWLL